MNRSLSRMPAPPVRQLAWRKAECSMRQLNAEDCCDDRVTENIFDIEDEHAAIDGIVRGSAYDRQ